MALALRGPASRHATILAWCCWATHVWSAEERLGREAAEWQRPLMSGSLRGSMHEAAEIRALAFRDEPGLSYSAGFEPDRLQTIRRGGRSMPTATSTGSGALAVLAFPSTACFMHRKYAPGK